MRHYEEQHGEVINDILGYFIYGNQENEPGYDNEHRSLSETNPVLEGMMWVSIAVLFVAAGYGTYRCINDYTRGDSKLVQNVRKSKVYEYLEEGDEELIGLLDNPEKLEEFLNGENGRKLKADLEEAKQLEQQAIARRKELERKMGIDSSQEVPIKSSFLRRGSAAMLNAFGFSPEQVQQSNFARRASAIFGITPVQVAPTNTPDPDIEQGSRNLEEPSTETSRPKQTIVKSDLSIGPIPEGAEDSNHGSESNNADVTTTDAAHPAQTPQNQQEEIAADSQNERDQVETVLSMSRPHSQSNLEEDSSQIQASPSISRNSSNEQLEKVRITEERSVAEESNSRGNSQASDAESSREGSPSPAFSEANFEAIWDEILKSDSEDASKAGSEDVSEYGYDTDNQSDLQAIDDTQEEEISQASDLEEDVDTGQDNGSNPPTNQTALITQRRGNKSSASRSGRTLTSKDLDPGGNINKVAAGLFRERRIDQNGLNFITDLVAKYKSNLEFLLDLEKRIKRMLGTQSHDATVDVTQLRNAERLFFLPLKQANDLVEKARSDKKIDLNTKEQISQLLQEHKSDIGFINGFSDNLPDFFDKKISLTELILKAQKRSSLDAIKEDIKNGEDAILAKIYFRSLSQQIETTNIAQKTKDALYNLLRDNMGDGELLAGISANLPRFLNKEISLEELKSDADKYAKSGAVERDLADKELQDYRQHIEGFNTLITKHQEHLGILEYILINHNEVICRTKTIDELEDDAICEWQEDLQDLVDEKNIVGKKEDLQALLDENAEDIEFLSQLHDMLLTEAVLDLASIEALVQKDTKVQAAEKVQRKQPDYSTADIEQEPIKRNSVLDMTREIFGRGERPPSF